MKLGTPRLCGSRLGGPRSARCATEDTRALRKALFATKEGKFTSVHRYQLDRHRKHRRPGSVGMAPPRRCRLGLRCISRPSASGAGTAAVSLLAARLIAGEFHGSERQRFLLGLGKLGQTRQRFPGRSEASGLRGGGSRVQDSQRARSSHLRQDPDRRGLLLGRQRARAGARELERSRIHADTLPSSAGSAL